jgi:hypothetical protein
MEQRAKRVIPKGSLHLFADRLVITCISPKKPQAVGPRYPEPPAVPFFRRAIETEEVLQHFAIGEFFFPVGTIEIDEKEGIS